MSGKPDSMWPADVRTLSVDIGGTRLKACVLGPSGEVIAERVRIDTPYPCPPTRLVAELSLLAARATADVPGVHRASVGFPGLVRGGCIVEVPSLSRSEYGGPADPELVAAWSGFDLREALAAAFAVPTKVVNDADMQGCAVVRGEGLEFVLTFGTGVGTALFYEGALLPHLELSHGPFRDGETVDIALGNAARKAIGRDRWIERVRLVIADFHEMLWFDRLYVGGGNAKHLTPADIGDRAELVENAAGLLGGLRIWSLDSR